MPAISGQDNVHLLQQRDWQQTVGQSGMTPTAFSFLIPVFVVAIVAPFLCIFCIRKRRRAITPVTTRVTPKVKKPALRREEARQKLKEITQVSSEVSSTTRDDQETTKAESRSVMERECAICLSTLHAPSPPEPAKLSPTSSISDAADASTTDPTKSTDTPTTTTAAVDTTTTPQPDNETILKLSVCGHEFHSECLVSWFVLRKTSCPICRFMYMSAEDMEKYDQEEQIALGGTPTPASPTSVDPEAQTAAGQSQPATSVRNWRYFIYGRDAFRREQERQARRQPDGQSGVELQDQTVTANTTTTAAAAGGETTPQAENQEQPAQSRWRRFFSRT